MSDDIPRLELRDLTRRLPSGGRELTILDRVSLAIAPGEFAAVLGPSGSGKSTLLALMAGLDRPTSGEVRVDGRPIQDLSEDELALLRRGKIGFVFQSFQLLGNLTARENVLLPAELADLPDPGGRADELLAAVGLADRGHHYPSQLSGGEQQRVALARALVTRPSVLLLDEPLGALDKKLRDHMKIELKRLQREVGITTIYVTHDQEEALTMSDRIAVMHRGRVEQVAPPRGLYETPATAFVAGFIGNINLLSGRAAGTNAVACGGATLAATGAAPAGAAVAVALRPERIRLDPAAVLDTVLSMTVAHVVYQGETVRYILKSEAGLELQAVELGEVRFAAGARVRAGWAAADARMIQEERA